MSQRYARALLVLVFFGFALMLVDVRHMHRDILSDEWQSWIPLFICALGLIATGLQFVTTKAKPVAYLVFAFGLAGGLYGSYIHSEGEAGRFLDLLATQDEYVYASTREERKEDLADRRDEPSPPLLAPLGLSGLCAFGLIAVASQEQQRRDS